MVTVTATIRPQPIVAKIPTTFVPLAPDRILVDKEIDLLVGLFHIMWEDMPHRRTYSLRLADIVSKNGNYVGCQIECGFPHKQIIRC